LEPESGYNVGLSASRKFEALKISGINIAWGSHLLARTHTHSHTHTHTHTHTHRHTHTHTHRLHVSTFERP
jgi:hypothetical protein